MSMSNQRISLSRRSFLGASVLLGCMGLSLIPRVAYAEPSQASSTKALEELKSIQARFDRIEVDYSTAQQGEEAARSAMDQAQQCIAEAQRQIDVIQGRLSQRVISVGQPAAPALADVLIGATSYQTLASRWDLLDKLEQSDVSLIQQASELQNQISSQTEIYLQQEGAATQYAEEATLAAQTGNDLAIQAEQTYSLLSSEEFQLLVDTQQAQRNQSMQSALLRIESMMKSPSGSSQSGMGQSGFGGSYAPTGNAIVDRAYEWLGIGQYEYGACREGYFDCSGFVSYCLTGTYERIGHTGIFITWPQVSVPQPGDVAVVHNNSQQHAGIYVGNGMMIHASNPSVGVVMDPVYDSMIFVRPPM